MTFRLTLGGVLSLATYVLFYVQPGVDRKAVLQWFFDIVPEHPLVGITVLALLVTQVAHYVCVLTFYVFYHFRFPFLEQYRVEGALQHQWDNPDEEQRTSYYELTSKATKQWLSNRITELLVVLGVIGLAYRSGYYTRENGRKIIEDTSPWWVSTAQLLVSLVIFETIFYWLHRLQHSHFYQYHKIHHEFKQPFSLTGFWGHQVDGFLTSIFPGLFPFLLFDMHLYTVLMWILVNQWHTYLDHAGYQLPWSPFQLIPFSNYVRAHNFHHSHNVGNFGLYWRLWDQLMGTDAAWKAYDKMQQRSSHKVD